MTAEQWRTGRKKAGLTQVAAARSLNVSQPYLSQLEAGLRAAGTGLARKAARLYELPPTALPLPEPLDVRSVPPDRLQRSWRLSTTRASSMFVPRGGVIRPKSFSAPS